MSKNNSKERRQQRRVDANLRASAPGLVVLKPCLCGKVHRFGWVGCTAVEA